MDFWANILTGAKYLLVFFCCLQFGRFILFAIIGSLGYVSSLVASGISPKDYVASRFKKLEYNTLDKYEDMRNVMEADDLASRNARSITQLFSTYTGCALPVQIKDGKHMNGHYDNRILTIKRRINSEIKYFHFEAQANFIDTPILDSMIGSYDNVAECMGIYDTKTKVFLRGGKDIREFPEYHGMKLGSLGNDELGHGISLNTAVREGIILPSFAYEKALAREGKVVGIVTNYPALDEINSNGGAIRVDAMPVARKCLFPFVYLTLEHKFAPIMRKGFYDTRSKEDILDTAMKMTGISKKINSYGDDNLAATPEVVKARSKFVLCHHMKMETFGLPSKNNVSNIHMIRDMIRNRDTEIDIHGSIDHRSLRDRSGPASDLPKCIPSPNMYAFDTVRSFEDDSEKDYGLTSPMYLGKTKGSGIIFEKVYDRDLYIYYPAYDNNEHYYFDPYGGSVNLIEFIMGEDDMFRIRYIAIHHGNTAKENHQLSTEHWANAGDINLLTCYLQEVAILEDGEYRVIDMMNELKTQILNKITARAMETHGFRVLEGRVLSNVLVCAAKRYGDARDTKLYADGNDCNDLTVYASQIPSQKNAIVKELEWRDEFFKINRRTPEQVYAEENSPVNVLLRSIFDHRND